MKSVVFATLATVIGFSAGLFGTYKMTPAIRTILGKEPLVLDEHNKFVEAATVALNPEGPTEAADGELGALSSEGVPEGGIPGEAGSATPLGSPASGDGEEGAYGIGSMIADAGEDAGEGELDEDGLPKRSPGLIEAALKESRETLEHNREQLDEVEALVAENDALRNQVLNVKRQRAEATELSKTLIRLEDRELRKVLSELDLGTLEVLYGQVSLRNRIRLLQNMPPDKAAGFIQQLTSGDTETVLTEAEREYSQ